MLSKRSFKKLGIFLSFFLCAYSSGAQQQYKLYKGLDIGMALGTGSVFAGTFILQKQVSPLPETTILSLKKEDIPAFDRVACTYWNRDIALASDALAGATVALPAYFYFHPETRAESFKIAVVSFQSLLLSQALSNSAKLVFQRNRPYLYGTAAPLEKKLKPDARMSFFSAHTTTVSSMCFSFALAHQAYLPGKHTAAVWAGAIALPALEGYMRVRAGKHYPTDVITGYLVGLGSSYLMHIIHNKRKKQGQ